MVLGHKSKRNSVASHRLNAVRSECQGFILPHYDRMNGARSALGAVSTVGGGRGGGRIAPGTFSSCLVLRKSFGLCRIYSKHHSCMTVVCWVCLSTEEPKGGRSSCRVKSDGERGLRGCRSRHES